MSLAKSKILDTSSGTAPFIANFTVQKGEKATIAQDKLAGAEKMDILIHVGADGAEITDPDSEFTAYSVDGSAVILDAGNTAKLIDGAGNYRVIINPAPAAATRVVIY